MGINKVIYGNTTLIDLENDTAEASDVVLGKTFHTRDGVQVTGTLDIQPLVDRVTALETKMGTATLNTTASKVTNAINELLNDINGTVTTYAVNSSITSSRGQLRVLKQGNVVYVAGGIGNATSTVSTSTNLFTALGSSYRPSSNTTIQGWVNDAMANFTVRTDGYIRQTLSSNMNNCFFVGFYKV